MDPVAALLTTAFHHRIDEPNVEAAQSAIEALSGPLPGFHAALAECLAQGWIEEPVRLEDHALQCHWRLELTPKGVAAGRALVEAAAQTAADKPVAENPANDDTTAPATPPTTQTTGAR